jgi:type III secretion protein J
MSTKMSKYLPTKMAYRWWPVVMALFLSACDQPLHHGLDEEEANAMVVVLDRAGYQADKIRDPDDGERWAVTVPSSQRVDAWEMLQQEGFPRRTEGGFGDFYPGGGLIPTATEERIVLQYATARELQTSLLRVDGIIDANVHLVLPEKPRVQMSGTTRAEPRASVLVQWRLSDGEPPLDEEEIRLLVSGGVEELAPEQVHVVMSPVAIAERDESAPQLVQVGPIAVAPASQNILQIMILLMGAVIIALSSGLVFVVFRARRKKSSGGTV